MFSFKTYHELQSKMNVLFLIFLRVFHLSYNNMLLNQLWSENGNTKNLLSNSFFQLQANHAITDIHVQLHE